MLMITNHQGKVDLNHNEMSPHTFLTERKNSKCWRGRGEIGTIIHYWLCIQRKWNDTLKRYLHPYVNCSIICSNQDTETTQMSFNRWIDKVIYKLKKKRKVILPFVTAWMNLEDIMWCEITQLQNNGYYMIPLIQDIKRVKLIGENRMVVCRGLGEGGNKSIL